MMIVFGKGGSASMDFKTKIMSRVSPPPIKAFKMDKDGRTYLTNFLVK